MYIFITHPVALDKSSCQIHKWKVQQMLVISAGTQAQMSVYTVVCIFQLELRNGLVLACGLTSVAPAYFRCFRSFSVQVWKAPHMPSVRTRTLRLALPPVLWSHWQTSTPTTALWRYWSTPVVCNTHQYNKCIAWTQSM